METDVEAARLIVAQSILIIIGLCIFVGALLTDSVTLKALLAAMIAFITGWAVLVVGGYI